METVLTPMVPRPIVINTKLKRSHHALEADLNTGVSMAIHIHQLSHSWGAYTMHITSCLPEMCVYH